MTSEGACPLPKKVELDYILWQSLARNRTKLVRSILQKTKSRKVIDPWMDSLFFKNRNNEPFWVRKIILR
ncbi:hypothetical protein EGI31_04135 [Lacihabitans soyangensis]|uniref:Uncharacterized protein n=1 Tax=Lacihabitans soyangensis TaxID=869394 RepID=A0AAE3GZX7_9BACT|nr:hypothetical protein [Lacihabitans soyangensis]